MEEEKKEFKPSNEERLIENQIHEEEIISENNFIETLCIIF